MRLAGAGRKASGSMGQRASECWPEIWHIIGPLIETPFRGGEASWMDDIFLEMNRRGFTEETHWTIEVSPIPDHSQPSRIGGVLGTVNEITEKVVGERRVQALRNLGTRAAEAKSAQEACAVAAENARPAPRGRAIRALLFDKRGSKPRRSRRG